MAVARFELAKQKAYEVLGRYDVAEPVVPVREIAEREGIKVVFFKPKDVTNSPSKEVSGFYFPDTAEPKIYVNAEDPSTRQLFTIAHELGHAVLGHKPDQYNVLWRFSSPIDKDPLEQEANCFAANLLVPEKMLFVAMKKYNLGHKDNTILASLFGVSPDVMKFRLRWVKNAL